MSVETTPLESGSTSWHAGLTRKHWRILTGSYLGWLFDGYETFALVLVLQATLATLLTTEQAANFPIYAGLVIGITLLGWGLGGLAGGVLADYFGRKRMMLISVLLYALFSGITAFSTSLTMLVVFRFLTGIALGSEWSTGIALVAESWPDRARPKGLGFLQSAFGGGAFIAAGTWAVLAIYSPLGDETWRLMFLIGALPALFVLYLRRALEESEQWLTALRQRRWGAVEGEEVQTGGSASAKRPFTLASVFRSPEGRRRVWLTTCLSFASTTGWWAGSAWLPVYAAQLAASQGAAASVWAPRIALIYTAGAVLAYLASGFVADALGRRRFLFMVFAGCLASSWLTFAVSWDIVVFSFIAFVYGVFTLGFAFSWMAIYPVELFTPSVRASAASVIFNGARLIAWIFPIISGTILTYFGGIVNAVLIISTIYAVGLVVPWFLPETSGKPLPR